MRRLCDRNSARVAQQRRTGSEESLPTSIQMSRSTRSMGRSTTGCPSDICPSTLASPRPSSTKALRASQRKLKQTYRQRLSRGALSRLCIMGLVGSESPDEGDLGQRLERPPKGPTDGEHEAPCAGTWIDRSHR